MVVAITEFSEEGKRPITSAGQANVGESLTARAGRLSLRQPVFSWIDKENTKS